MIAADVIAAWDRPEAAGSIHPTRGISEDAYWASGRAQADLLAADIPAGARVLDFGCGDGRISIALRALGYDVTGADASEHMLTALTANDPDLTAFQSTGDNFTDHFGRRKVDAAVCLAVLIHHDYATSEHLVTALRGIVKKGGTLALDWPTSDDPAEGAAWLDVTTWDRQRQNDLAGRLKMERLDNHDRPWSLWRAL
jgi:2-polyprenyl-3-methyl-5-hydroxy-6-metoxy-1,4-benzoquinol methylase